MFAVADCRMDEVGWLANAGDSKSESLRHWPISVEVGVPSRSVPACDVLCPSHCEVKLPLHCGNPQLTNISLSNISSFTLKAGVVYFFLLPIRK